MCRLVPLELPNGLTVQVAEHKKNKLLKYLEYFPEIPQIHRVILFGSVLEERCSSDSDIDMCFIYDGERRDYHTALNTMYRLYDESCEDDMLGWSWEDYVAHRNIRGALKDVISKGVVIYDCDG